MKSSNLDVSYVEIINYLVPILLFSLDHLNYNGNLKHESAL